MSQESAPPSAQQPAQQPAGQPGRYQRSPSGLIGALIILVVLLVGYVAVRSLLEPERSNPVATVDYASVVPQAKKTADFDLQAPPKLPSGWRATTVSFSDTAPQHWHLGVLTNEKRYVGLEQGTQSVGAMVETYVAGDAARGAAVPVGDTPWASYTDSKGDLALVHRQGRTTTLVLGHEVPRATLVSYIESLR